MSERLEFNSHFFLPPVSLFTLVQDAASGPQISCARASRDRRAKLQESTVNFQDEQGWKVASPQDAMLRGNWWEVFNEPELNALEVQLNINNQNIKVSFENFMAARAVIAEARAQYWPTITTNPSWNRSQHFGQSARSPPRPAPEPPTRLWTLPLDVLLDARFLGQDSQPGAAKTEYAAQVSAADLELEKLTEQACLAQYFFEIRGQDMLQRF